MENGGSRLPGQTIGFAFIKSSKPKKLDVRVQESEQAEERKHQVSSLSGNSLQRLAAEPEKAEVIIPMIKENRWVVPPAGGGGAVPPLEKVEGDGPAPMSLEAEAVQAILAEAGALENKEEESNLVLPLLVQNKVPGLEDLSTEDEKFRHDVAMRPDAPDLEAYQKVSVEDFGVALLKGMGWQKDVGIGLTNQKVVKPIEFVPRGHLLGLGATEAKVPEKKRKRILKPGEKEDAKPLVRVAPTEDGRAKNYKTEDDRVIPVHSVKLQAGALVEFVGGAHKGLYGTVMDVDAQKSRVTLHLNEEVVTVYNAELQVMDRHAVPSDHPALKRSSGSAKRKGVSEAERGKDGRATDPFTSASKKPRVDEPVTWVVPHIRVTIVSKSLDGGKHYSKKGRVEDVVDKYHFNVVLDDGTLVEGVLQRNVETAVPKEGGRVMIVHGEHKRKTGVIIERSKSSSKAAIQLDNEPDIVTCGFDDIAQYMD